MRSTAAMTAAEIEQDGEWARLRRAKQELARGENLSLRHGKLESLSPKTEEEVDRRRARVLFRLERLSARCKMKTS